MIYTLAGITTGFIVSYYIFKDSTGLGWDDYFTFELCGSFALIYAGGVLGCCLEDPQSLIKKL